MDDLVEKQTAEVKELETKIEKMRKKLASMNKKQKKSASQDIIMLETQLEFLHSTHKDQRDDLVDGGTGKARETSAETEKDQETPPENATFTSNEVTSRIEGNTTSNEQPQKISKAQKRREKKEREARERDERIAAAEVDDKDTKKFIEYTAIREILEPLKLKTQPIKADGHCMFAAVASQLEDKPSIKDLREAVARCLREKKDEFMPFMLDDNGDLYGDEAYEEYCAKMASTAVWGGECELKALSMHLKQPIKVFQAGASPRTIGEYECDKPLLVSYHRHEFSLGAHYNAVVPM
eukprot:m.187834 g.187834  ORF g.187834 m.187834 type:complete len:295 (-) comp18513_c0_seq1:249-1133(-)